MLTNCVVWLRMLIASSWLSFEREGFSLFYWSERPSCFFEFAVSFLEMVGRQEVRRCIDYDSTVVARPRFVHYCWFFVPYLGIWDLVGVGSFRFGRASGRGVPPFKRFFYCKPWGTRSWLVCKYGLLGRVRSGRRPSLELLSGIEGGGVLVREFLQGG